jgi:hypothetical protein
MECSTGLVKNLVALQSWHLEYTAIGPDGSLAGVQTLDCVYGMLWMSFYGMLWMSFWNLCRWAMNPNVERPINYWDISLAPVLVCFWIIEWVLVSITFLCLAITSLMNMQQTLKGSRMTSFYMSIVIGNKFVEMLSLYLYEAILILIKYEMLCYQKIN